MAQDKEDMVPLDPEFLAELEEEAASRYSEEDNQFMEVECVCLLTHMWYFVSTFLLIEKFF